MSSDQEKWTTTGGYRAGDGLRAPPSLNCDNKHELQGGGERG